LKKKSSGGKSKVKLAQELVDKKCGVIQEEDHLEAMTLQEYLDLYKEPLTDKSMEAILKLSEVATEKKKNKT
jgi:ABC-type transport system involved in cytochrome bd biosynthesis fused ATPase/permease subunit